MDLHSLNLEVREGVAVVKMNNPPVNATSEQMMRELTSTFDSFTDRDDVRVAVLTGEGRAFCAGADLKAPAPIEPGERWGRARLWRECSYSIMECRKPVIAAINGHALGAGLALAASCDILLASENATFGLPEIDVGALGGARRAMRLFGHSKVRRMMFTGVRLPASELERLGVLEAVVPAEALMESAQGIAREIAAKSPLAISLAKLALNTIEGMSIRDGYRFEQDMTGELQSRSGRVFGQGEER